MSKFTVLLYKIFFIGLLLQFVLHTFVTFQLGLDQERMTYIWLWKEAIVGILLLISLGSIIRHRSWKQLGMSRPIGWFTLGLIAAIGSTALIHFNILGLGVGTYILAFKYDFFGFIILLAGVHSGSFLSKEQRQELLERYTKVIKRTLLAALVWFLIIFIKPGTLKLLGYDNFAFEGNVGMQPPAAYYSLINHGMTRNQFLFERPISRGFFLTALFPFFFMTALYKKPLKHTRAWRVIYGCNVILCFSRAAWGAWIIELGIIGVTLYRKTLMKHIRKFLIPGILFAGLIGTYGYKTILHREYSDTGHVEMVKQGIKIRSRNPLFGQGGSSAGPGSHRKGEETHLGRAFNPENQYLQILVEFGLVGFLGWFLLYLTLNGIGFHYRQKEKTHLPISNQESDTVTPTELLLAASLGMIGLSISGLVLHSFSDRMIVYPYMLLFGIIWIHWIQSKTNSSGG